MNETTTAESPVRTYRGESMVSLLAQIREELGPDAVILRQREGLVGGVGGFFQKRCVEVDARPGGPGIDVYDEQPADEGDWADGSSAGPVAVGDPPPPAVAKASSGAVPPTTPPAADPSADAAGTEFVVRNDAATREGLATPAIQELVEQAQPFAEVLSDFAEAPAVEAEAPEPAVEPAAPAVPETPQPRRAETLREGMVASGLGEDLAAEVVDSVLASAMPFATPARLRTLVRNELALRLPVARAAAPGPRTIVMVGPAGSGKSTAIAAIAAAHAAQDVPVACLTIEQLAGRGEAPEGLMLVDTPPLWGGAEELKRVAAAVRKLRDPEVHLVMRAGTAAAAAAELLDGLSALRPNRLLLSGAGETSHLGGVLDLALRTRTELGYVAESPREIALADPRELATRVTP